MARVEDRLDAGGGGFSDAEEAAGDVALGKDCSRSRLRQPATGSRWSREADTLDRGEESPRLRDSRGRCVGTRSPKLKTAYNRWGQVEEACMEEHEKRVGQIKLFFYQKRTGLPF